MTGIELKKIIRGSGLTMDEMANKLGISRQTLHTYINKAEIDNNIINKVNSALQIVKPDAGITRFTKGNHSGSQLVPYYEVDFYAGNSLELLDNAITPAYYMDIPEFRGCTAFRAYSDSMEHLIHSGNILFGRKIDDWKSHLEYGQIYEIITFIFTPFEIRNRCNCFAFFEINSQLEKSFTD